MRTRAIVLRETHRDTLIAERYRAINELFPVGFGTPYPSFSTPYLLMRAIDVPAVPDFLPASMKCAHCGLDWIEGAAFCVYCLRALSDATD